MVLVKSVEVDIGVKGDRESKAKLDDITKRAETLKKAFPEYKLKIDAAAASERLKVFRAQLAEATKTRTAEVKVKVDDSALSRFASKMKSGGGPAWLGPALLALPAAGTLGGVAAGAGAGLSGAFVAGGAALAAFGAVAKPVLTDAQKAAQAVEKAQNNYNIAIAAGAKQSVAYKAEQVAIAKAYSELSPAQIALSKQLQAMGNAWQAVKAAQTPVVAGALQPWLKSVTGLTASLPPIIAKVAPVIASLGARFDGLVNSSAFRGFRDFVASTGSKVIGAGGSTLIDFVKAFMILLPKFNPLILKMTGGIAGLGPAVLKWASSKATADHITHFMDWFSKNGPVVGGLLKNIGGALKALAPGLAAGGTAELQALSGFFGFVAKLPPAIAKPLAEVAGALLLLNKLGVVKAGVNLVGWTFGKGGGAGAAAGGGEAAAGAEGAAAGSMMGKLTPGLKWAVKGGLLVAGAKIALSIAASQAPTAAPQDARHFQASTPGAVKRFLGFFFGGDVNTANVSAYLHHLFGAAANWGPQEVFDLVRHKIAVQWDGIRHDITHYWDMTWNNTIGRTQRGFHDLAGWFDTGRHQVAARTGQAGRDVVSWWNITWANTITRTARGFHDLAGWFDRGRHDTAASLGLVRHDTAAAWDQVWNNTAGRAARGVRDVMGWIGTLPGRVTGVFRNAGEWLVFGGANIINGLWNGIKAIWHGVEGWFAGLPSKILHALGIHSPPPWAIDAGRHIMGGLLKGLAHNAADVRGFFRGIALDVTGPFKGIWSGLASAGKDVWHFLFGGGGTSQKLPDVGSGVARWAPLVRQALAMEHLNPNYILDVLYQMLTESGGNPNAINLTDINAQRGDPSRGLMQTIMSTFLRWHWPGTSMNIYDPLANIAAALNYAAHGRGFGTGYGQIGSGHGYALGTPGAAAGWAWVGERGPELIRFRGGEQVAPVHAGSGGRGGPAIIIEQLIVNAPVGSNPRDIGRQVAEVLGAHIKAGGRIYPAGVTPR